MNWRHIFFVPRIGCDGQGLEVNGFRGGGFREVSGVWLLGVEDVEYLCGVRLPLDEVLQFGIGDIVTVTFVFEFFSMSNFE